MRCQFSAVFLDASHRETVALTHVVTELHMPPSTSHHQQREFDVHCVDTWEFCRYKQVWLVVSTHLNKCLGSSC